jgi:hypothetical protein
MKRKAIARELSLTTLDGGEHHRKKEKWKPKFFENKYLLKHFQYLIFKITGLLYFRDT